MLEFHLSTIVWEVINLLVLYLFLREFLFGRRIHPANSQKSPM